MYQALYRAFRPETFDGIMGQEHIVKILKNQIAGDSTGHAYLFCGTRGTGKTSMARILAKGVNCTSLDMDKPCGFCNNCLAIKGGVFLDVIEIDAASNNGVENIRELRESIKYPPVVGRCKVYIIDEVHMLSTGAFNALLKTLEEPPQNVMFILATTEPQKLPATILSRCLRLDFRRISEQRMRLGMREICTSLDVKISDSALALIVANADGSVRDGLSLLDQCISAGGKEVVRQDILEFLGHFWGGSLCRNHRSYRTSICGRGSALAQPSIS
jgi:DNA polymerase III subunit gamma/tau